GADENAGTRDVAHVLGDELLDGLKLEVHVAADTASAIDFQGGRRHAVLLERSALLRAVGRGRLGFARLLVALGGAVHLAFSGALPICLGAVATWAAAAL